MSEQEVTRRTVLSAVGGVVGGAVLLGSSEAQAEDKDDKKDKKDDKKDSKVISAAEFLKGHPKTVVLHYQPEGFILLRDPTSLRRWERDLRDKVGLKGFTFDASTESGCDTITGGVPDACDTD